jgi:hypothetical protein
MTTVSAEKLSRAAFSAAPASAAGGLGSAVFSALGMGIAPSLFPLREQPAARLSSRQKPRRKHKHFFMVRLLIHNII